MLTGTTSTVLHRNRVLFWLSIQPVLAVLLAVLLTVPAFAEIRPGSYSVSPYIGGFLFEGNQDLEHRPVYGLRLGYDFTKNWGAEGVFGYVGTKFKATDSTTDVYNYRLEGLYHLWPDKKLVPFLAVGAGGMSINSRDSAADRNRFAVDYGAGLKYSLTDRIALRADVRHVLAFGSTYNNLEYTVGLVFYFGGSKAAAAQPVQETREAATTPAVLPALSAPLHLTATPASDSRINLNWEPAVGATGYKIYRDGAYVASTQATSAPDAGLKANTRYCYTVSATDGMDRESGRSNEACAVTLPLAAGMEAPKVAAAAMPYDLEDIHFDFDKYDLKPEAREILDRHAAWLIADQQARLWLIVEGHCDERGTMEYNLALGEKRANSAAKYLIDKGIDAQRIQMISYGFSRPIDPRHNEEAWAKNRRVHLIVTDEKGGAKK